LHAFLARLVSHLHLGERELNAVTGRELSQIVAVSSQDPTAAVAGRQRRLRSFVGADEQRHLAILKGETCGHSYSYPPSCRESSPVSPGGDGFSALRVSRRHARRAAYRVRVAARRRDERQKCDDLADSIRALCRCPITLCAPADPVVASDGYTYERAALEEWRARSRSTRSPLSRETLSVPLYPNRCVREVALVLSERPTELY
jgi:hypothetical protein